MKMVRFRLIHLTLMLWCCVLFNKATVDCHPHSNCPINRHKRLISEKTSEKDLVKGLVLEALELENNFSELKKSSNGTALYQSLSDRVNGVRLHDGNQDNERALSHLRSILRYKLIDMKEESSLIIDVESYANHVASTIDLRMGTIPGITNINDMDLKNDLNELRFRANGNFALNEYRRYVEGFRFTYFPYAACYLESLQIPATPTAYDNLDAITSAITDHLNEAKRHIEDMKSSMRDVTYLEGKEPDDALYTWKSADIRDEISRLLKGEQITLVADVKTATKQLNALKFNKLDLIFRSSNQTIHNQLGDAVKAFMIHLKHNGQSAFRYNDHFYHVDSMPMKMFFTFEKTKRGDPVMRNAVYTKLRDSRPKLSPYTEWELKLTDSRTRFHRLAPFEQLDIDIELHGSGSYAEDDLPSCIEESLSKFYTQMEN